MSRNPGLPVKRTEKSEDDHVIINPFILALRHDRFCRCRDCKPSLVRKAA